MTVIISWNRSCRNKGLLCVRYVKEGTAAVCSREHCASRHLITIIYLVSVNLAFCSLSVRQAVNGRWAGYAVHIMDKIIFSLILGMSGVGLH